LIDMAGPAHMRCPPDPTAPARRAAPATEDSAGAAVSPANPAGPSCQLRLDLRCIACVRVAFSIKHPTPRTAQHISARASKRDNIQRAISSHHRPEKKFIPKAHADMEAAVAYTKAEADNHMATELRLGLPGTADDGDQTPKATPPSTPRGKKRTTTFDAVEDAAEEANTKRDVEAAPPAAK
jgi:hypothetical protein